MASSRRCVVRISWLTVDHILFGLHILWWRQLGEVELLDSATEPIIPFVIDRTWRIFLFGIFFLTYEHLVMPGFC